MATIYTGPSLTAQRDYPKPLDAALGPEHSEIAKYAQTVNQPTHID